ncbi:MAG: hypothetical protein KGJ06_08060 [Pseudomonadota bacterium]|nr:hypothetical protein [Pseudomonadota bacterium]
MILELAASKLPTVTEHLLSTGLKEHFKKQEEAVQQILLGVLKSGSISLEEIAKKDNFIGSYYRIADAALKGVTNKNLRLMCKALRGGIEQELSDDKINTVLSIIADLSEEEILILAKFSECKQKEIKDNSINAQKRLKDQLTPVPYSADYLDAVLGRLLRTGLVIAKPGWEGLIMEPSPLLDQFITLAELQAHNFTK